MIEPVALRTASVFGLDVSTLCFQFVCDSIELALSGFFESCLSLQHIWELAASLSRPDERRATSSIYHRPRTRVEQAAPHRLAGLR